MKPQAMNPGRVAVLGLLAALAACTAVAATSPPLLPAPQTYSLLGDTLYTPPLADSTRARYQRLLAEAQRNFDHYPNEINNILWLGRRTAYLGRFRDAIAIYTAGIKTHPGEARLFRHRGHRYITLRMFELAVGDLEYGLMLTKKRTDSVEPDGLPNARNIPTTTLKFNLWYHLGLAYYLEGEFAEARRAWRECLKVSTNPDMLCATTNWLYMTLRRLGRESEARRLLKPIRGDMDVIENRSYLRLLLMYKGELPIDSLYAKSSVDSEDPQYATTGYGIGNWYLYHGRASDAAQIFERVTRGSQWPAFGHIAAEAELKRMYAAKR
jgi:tetratricopeptide (TPR) repeat protein